MNIKKIIREEIDDMDWIRDVKPMITRSFGELESEGFIELDGVDVVYIYGDVVYETFIDDGYHYANLNGEKFKIVEIKHDVGVIVLECLDNSLINDYKHLLFDIKDDGRAETIIGDYANDNKLVFKFVINNLNESDDMDWIRAVEPQIKPGAKFKSVTSGIILTVTEIDGKWILYDLFNTDGSVITKHGSLPFNNMQNDIDDGSWIPVP